MMRFFSPQYLWLILPWAILLIFIFLLENRASLRLQRFASLHVLKDLLIGYSSFRKKFRILLLWFSMLFFILALARPQMGIREETVPTQGLDLVFLLDVSNSMLTEDVIPSRLKKAKHVIRTFLDKLSGDRVGVIAFAGSAYPAIPLTTDYDFIRQTIDVVDEKIILNQGTDLFKALKTGMDLLDRGGVNSSQSVDSEDQLQGSRVIVILSDGEDHEGAEAGLHNELKDKNVRVYSIGVGSAKGGPIPLRDLTGYLQGYKKDRSGSMVQTKLETKALESIAKNAGGKFFSASANEGEVDEIISELTTMDRSEGSGRKIQIYQELFQLPLGFGIFLFFIFLSIREASMVIAIFAFSLMISQPLKAETESLKEYQENKKGIDAYEEKNFSEAIEAFGKAQAESPEKEIHRLNLGDAFYRSGAFDRAGAEFSKILSSEDKNIAAKGAFNLGKAYEGQKDHEKSMQSYQEGLKKLATTEHADPETILRLKMALEKSQNQKNKGDSKNKDKDQNKDSSGNKDDKNQEQNDEKDKKDQQKEKEDKQNEKQYKNPKPKFKPEKLSDTDAKRILQQLRENEKQTQQRVMKNKSGKPEKEQPTKDW